MVEIRMRRPRRERRIFRPILSEHERCPACQHCQALAEQAERDRPGHVWSVANEEIIYMEDAVMEQHLGRKLKATESVVHKNGNALDNRFANLELVTLEGID